MDEVLSRARATPVVMIGEQHDQATHHALQADVVAALASDGPSLVVGLEMLPWERQEALDAFNAGRLDAEGLAAAVDWKSTWGFDFSLYAPIFRAGHERGATFRALNPPRALVRAVRAKGVEGLSAAERAILPELDLGDDAHRAWFRGLFQSPDSAGSARERHGPHHAMDDAAFAGFYAAQVTWDEAMAQTTVRALEDGARQVVVIAGAGHVARGRGVPQRVERRRPDVRVLTIVPLAHVDRENVEATLREAVAVGEADVLAVPRFEDAIDV
jgi:uncharacterized iron-regulated protein